ncbi:hypothetical protein AVEN_85459-1 [Araneus ventricosus]|uniref:Uncharacterized protein n=1 Tax=Araneus ventricosus TaxID=182803 RepID=A0A4Y2GY03_ARAVE|nr:hypothetical protein AVEN_85459-1 [Araneus ventricosus]
MLTVCKHKSSPTPSCLGIRGQVKNGRQDSSWSLRLHPNPPHLISSHLISSHLISSHLISSHLISSHLISSRPVPSHPIPKEEHSVVGSKVTQPHTIA